MNTNDIVESFLLKIPAKSFNTNSYLFILFSRNGIGPE